jgi:hypothetical protein
MTSRDAASFRAQVLSAYSRGHFSVLDGLRQQEAVAYHRIAVEEALRGKPGLWCESYLVVFDPLEKRVVPFRFNENQQRFYDETFGHMASWKEPLRVFVLKDRKATSTTFWMAVAFCYACVVMSWRALLLADSEKTAQTVLRMTKLFYDNLPIEAKPQAGHWTKGEREFLFGEVEKQPNGTMGLVVKQTSTIEVASVKSEVLGLGDTATMLIKTERGKWEPLYEAAAIENLENSAAAATAWDIDESTPVGRTGFHAAYKAIVGGDIAATLLVCYWFHNKANRLPRAHPLAAPKDRGKLEYTADEQGIVGRLFGEGSSEVEVEECMRWRRTQIARATVANLGVAALGMASFLREHMEDDISCFADATNPALDLGVITNLRTRCRRPSREERLGPGMVLRLWEEYRAGEQYVLGLDPAGGARDPICAQLYRRHPGGLTKVGDIFGLGDPLYFLEEAIKLGETYGTATLVIERNGLGGIFVKWARDRKYRKLWSEPHTGRSMPSQIKYGFYMDAPSREAAYYGIMKALKIGQIVTPCTEDLDDYSQWRLEEHTPDRVAPMAMVTNIYIRSVNESGPYETELQATEPDPFWRWRNLGRPMPAETSGYYW